MSPNPDRRYLGRKMQDHWEWVRGLVATLLAGFACTIAAQFVCLLLFRRKIASLARFTYAALPHA